MLCMLCLDLWPLKSNKDFYNDFDSDSNPFYSLKIFISFGWKQENISKWFNEVLLNDKKNEQDFN